MMRVTCFILVFLCYFQTICSITPTSTGKGQEFIFSYHANIDVRNSACNHGFARWILSGKLISQNFNGYMVMKLKDLKTSIFNGQRENLKQANEIPISEEAQALLQPFIVHTEEDGNIAISVEPNEPLWSLNMKRGIANNFHLDMDQHESTEFTAQEKSIYGECEVLYKLVPSNETVLKKITDYNKCSKKARKHVSNVHAAPAAKGFEPIQMKSVKTYTTKEENGVPTIHNIHSVSHLVYQAMPKIPNLQHVDQYQEFDLLELKDIDKEIDTTNITNKNDIIFEFGEEPSKERRSQSSNEITNLNKEFFENFQEFEKILRAKPLQNHNIKNKDTVENMLNILMKMDKDEMKNLAEEINLRENNLEKYTFSSLLPYIGTNHTMEYLFSLVNSQNNEFVFNEYILMRLFVICPTYINFPLDDKLEDMERLLIDKNYNHAKFKNTAFLSFVSIIEKGVKNGHISEKYVEKYERLFRENFLDSNFGYEQRMTYLLALINLAEYVKTDFIFEITTNSSENSHLRSLALTGFKKHLSTQPQVFEKFWPIVQNTTEQLELRIRALDLVLATNLSEEQFNEILKSQTGYKTDLYERHIASYFVSTLRSLQKENCYDDAIGTLASAALKTEHFPDYSREWITGNYRVSYTDDDPNMGFYFQSRLIGNPKTSTLNVIHFTCNQFVMSFDMGTYDIYIKLHGIPESVYQKEILSVLQTKNITSIPELLELLKKFNFEMKSISDDIHFEFVLFIDGRAVYGIYSNFERFSKTFNLLKSFTKNFIMNVPLTISYPLTDYTYVPSDLGTPLSIMSDVQDIRLKEYDTSTTIAYYRSSWYYQTWVESYNPVVDTTLASYKYNGDKRFVNLNISSPSQLTLKWTWKNDSVNWVYDKLIGTTVSDKKLLEIYCPKCDTVHEIPTDVISADIENIEYLGVKMNVTNMKNELQIKDSKIVQEFLKIHHSNADSLPYLKSALMFHHFVNHAYYFNTELRRASYRTIDFYNEPGETTVSFRFDQIGYKNRNPFTNKAFFYVQVLLDNKLFNHEESISHWNITYGNLCTPKYKTDDSKLKVKILQTFNLNYTSSGDTNFMICAERELLFPDMRTDKFSILPVQPGTGKIKLFFGQVAKNESTETCPTQYILTEKYSATEDQTKKAKTMKQYEECEKNAQGLTFTPPTPACLPIFMTLSQYNHYSLNLIQKDAVEKEKLVQIAEITRNDNDKLKFSISKSTSNENVLDDKFEFVITYPYRMTDPTAIAYFDFDILANIKRSCTISSKTIKTFTGKFIPFDEEKSVVLIECVGKARHGLTVDKISDTKIGFKLWSNENVLTATVEETKLKVMLNGKYIHENYDEDQKDEFRVYFMDNNVIYIIDDKIQLYYNTEYIYLKGFSMYNAYSCGFCNSE